jgi:hypothetical protein
MKCPKCSYISFDYNASCPKCNKDITSEGRKLNLPPYKPFPPSLLGTLTGETNDSYAGLIRNTYTGQGPDESQMDVGLDDSGEIGSGVFDDGQDLDISLGPEGSESGEIPAPEPSGEEGEDVYSLDDLKIDDSGELKLPEET